MSLETDLRDLGAHLDHPPGDGIAAAVRAEVTHEPRGPIADAVRARRPSRGRRVVLLAAAVLVVVAIAVSGVVVVSGSRGEGDRAQAHPTVPSTAPRPTTTTIPPVVALGLEQARTAVQFPIRVPQGLTVPAQVLVDRRIAGGLVALQYPAFTLVELPTPANASVTEVTSADAGSTAHPMVVRGQPALWITGTPEIGYVDQARTLHRAPTRAGNALVWVEHGVTYRIEGFRYQSSAMAMADALA
jgi:hypothetical protein